ncbi:CDP-diacylglycerol--serine O-phosphatidyltransferase [Candidatus Pelagibacter ubique]|jgi:CDP-diacylglycerol---serine O-phosphatidyltransferase|uniref:CDP-diacylglycerol--serine O-phosphatidyltransferase n=1 Tax=Pelagibacter ubique TaxID=198252 RepID=A0ABX1SYQ2_PELUQ|nr:CDP-diacylglycerol--serine O-phosphatidyltransferase [Candidatus Pelagibacter ubique]NMN66972.1 CDP-diacylglycerol--serine O-phosphatidyltransferase [Candidatus Pelagibacter ubique]
MEQPKKNFKIVSDKKTRMILPNAITLVGVCIGLSSIKFALDGKFALAIIAILFAGLMDALDGRIARLIKGTSKMGKELDSLGDVISFGVAPAFIMYFWNLQYLDKLGWFVCLMYVVCVALRLARFNVNSEDEPSWKDNFFEGIPAPAGGIVVLMPLVINFSGLDDLYLKFNYDFIVPMFFIIISILLISTVPTYSFKKIVIPRTMTKFLLFGIVLFFGALLVYTFKILAISTFLYLCLIPVSYFHYKKIKKEKNITNDINENDNIEDIL